MRGAPDGDARASRRCERGVCIVRFEGEKCDQSTRRCIEITASRRLRPVAFASARTSTTRLQDVDRSAGGGQSIAGRQFNPRHSERSPSAASRGIPASRRAAPRPGRGFLAPRLRRLRSESRHPATRSLRIPIATARASARSSPDECRDGRRSTSTPGVSRFRNSMPDLGARQQIVGDRDAIHRATGSSGAPPHRPSGRRRAAPRRPLQKTTAPDVPIARGRARARAARRVIRTSTVLPPNGSMRITSYCVIGPAGSDVIDANRSRVEDRELRVRHIAPHRRADQVRQRTASSCGPSLRDRRARSASSRRARADGTHRARSPRTPCPPIARPRAPPRVSSAIPVDDRQQARRHFGARVPAAGGGCVTICTDRTFASPLITGANRGPRRSM